MMMKKLGVYGLVALLPVLLAPAAHAASCATKGSFRKGTKVRIEARVRAPGWWESFVYREVDAEPIGRSYQRMAAFDVSSMGEWYGYFHVMQPSDQGRSTPATYVRCDIRGKANKEGLGTLEELAIRFDSLECTSMNKNSNGTLVPSSTPLPFRVSCSRNFNPTKKKLTVRLSFE